MVGSKGEKGDRGETGPAGPQGITGAAGPPGPRVAGATYVRWGGQHVQQEMELSYSILEEQLGHFIPREVVALICFACQIHLTILPV